jgi:hypothetical protein
MRNFVPPTFLGLALSLAALGVVAPVSGQAAGPTAQAKNPCAANPCAAKNPCAARNPCAAAQAAAVKDPVATSTAKQYRSWKKVNDQPVLSATHGNRYVFTYINKAAEPSALNGRFPFPAGAILAKESFEGQAGKPGPKGPLFVMEKRKQGYDPDHADWHYAVVAPDGSVSMSGSGKEGSPTAFCAACHQQAKANDYVFGNGTTMKVKPTAMGAPANPCAPKNPCAPGNPCAPKNPCAGTK